MVALGTSTPTSMTVVETSTSMSPAAKARMVRSFSSGASRPCSWAEPQARERALGELGEQLLDGVHRRLRGRRRCRPRRRRPGRSRPARGSSPVIRGHTTYTWWPLATSSRTRCQTRLEPGGLVEERDDVGLDRGPAGRELGERRDLEVAEHGHRDGARDRRRGHHQDVGRRARLVGERGPLLDAEPVLLVDDDQAEVGEGDLLLEQRVGADHDAGLAAGGPQHRLLALGLAHRAGEQRDGGALGRAAEHAAGREVAEQRGDRAVVLLREHLGRAPAARPGRRSRRCGAWPARRPASCRSRPRPGAAGSSGGAGPGRPRSRRRPPLAGGQLERQPLVERRQQPAALTRARLRRPAARSSARRRASTSWVTRASSNRNRRWARLTWP